jgi:membrane protein implicated in regulation of membrane protease activity
MMAVFLTSLVIGLGAVAIQLFGGHDVGHDVGGHDGGGHDDGPLLFLASIRFWAFALLAFGLVGTLLLFFGFAGTVAAAIIAGVAGVGSGYVAASVVRRLQGQGTSSVATTADVVGRVGRVIVPPSAEARGKVRVSVRGRDVDYVAKSNEALDADDTVLVEECEEDGEVRVSRAPKELTEPR